MKISKVDPRKFSLIQGSNFWRIFRFRLWRTINSVQCKYIEIKKVLPKAILEVLLFRKSILKHKTYVISSNFSDSEICILFRGLFFDKFFREWIKDKYGHLNKSRSMNYLSTRFLPILNDVCCTYLWNISKTL